MAFMEETHIGFDANGTKVLVRSPLFYEWPVAVAN